MAWHEEISHHLSEKQVYWLDRMARELGLKDGVELLARANLFGRDKVERYLANRDEGQRMTNVAFAYRREREGNTARQARRRATTNGE